MKKIYISGIVLSLFLGQAFAQRVAADEIKINREKPTGFSRTQNDTLRGTFNWSTVQIGLAQGGGYIAGNNAYGDLQKAQAYIVNDSVYVSAIVIIFGAKQTPSTDPQNRVSARLYRMDATGTSDTGEADAPGTVLASVDITAADIDTSATGWNAVDLFEYPKVGGMFAVGVDFSNMAANNYAGILMSRGDENNPVHNDMSWEQWDNGTWYSMLESWPRDVAFAIFPVVNSQDPTSIKNQGKNKFKLYQNVPNPLSKTTTLFYELFEPSEVVIEVFDISGRSVFAKSEGYMPAGKSMAVIDAANFTAGVYYYSVNIGQFTLTKKMVVVK
jgi:hypothetical protein